MIQVGIIGSGFIGPAHIEALRRVGDIEVVALCDHSLAQAEQKARQLNVAHAYGSVEGLLAHPGLQVVHNCTPNHLHAGINRQILRAGLHVFSEKPLCMRPEEARELVALAEKAGVVHGVSFVYRQFAMVQQAASMIREGLVGRLFSAHGSYLQDWMLLQTDYNWRVESELGGASRAMADIGSHWCDTVQFMTGRRITEVMADLSTVWPTRRAALQGDATFSQQGDGRGDEERAVDTEDRGSVLVRFDDGSKGCFSVSQVSAGRKNQLTVEISGSACALAWDQEIPQRLWVGQRDRPNQTFSDDPSLMQRDVAGSAHFPAGHIEGWPDAFKNMMLSFYQAVRAGAMPDARSRRFASFYEGADVMYIVEAILRSHQQQRWVSVER